MSEGGVWLLRHGETGQCGFRGRLNDALTPEGWMQMQVALDTMPSGSWDAIVSSPLRRCAAFAENFAWRLGVPLRLDARLSELDFGRWEGADAETLMAREPHALGAFWRDPWSNPPPEGESVAALEARALAAWRDVSRDGACRTLVVTHGGVIRVLLRLARGLPPAELLAIAVPHASLHRLDAASIPDLTPGEIPCPISARS